MKTVDLKYKLGDLRYKILSVITDVMGVAKISEIDVNDISASDNPTITANGETQRLIGIKQVNNDLSFEFRNIRGNKVITFLDEDLATDDLIKFAEWVETYEDDIVAAAEKDRLDDNTMLVKVEWGSFAAGVLGLDEEVEVPAGLEGSEVYDYLEDMYGFRPSGWEII